MCRLFIINDAHANLYPDFAVVGMDQGDIDWISADLLLSLIAIPDFSKRPQGNYFLLYAKSRGVAIDNLLATTANGELLATKTRCTRHVVILYFQVLPTQARTQSYSLFILSDTLPKQAFKALRRQLRMLGINDIPP